MSGILNPAVLVLGAGSIVGQGVVGALLEAGSPVLATGGDAQGLAGLARHFAHEPGLAVLHAGDAHDDDRAAQLVRTLEARGRPLRAVIASLGSPLEGGRLIDRPTDFLRGKLERDVLPHLAAARHLVPLLGRNEGASHYILLGGPHAERGWAGYGHASIAAAALRMLANVLHEEAAPLGVRVQMLSVDSPLCTPENARNACAQWPNAMAVGRHAVSLLTGNDRALPVVRFEPGRALLPAQPLFERFPLPNPQEISP